MVIYKLSSKLYAVEDCQKRWKTLRERYVKEMKKRRGKVEMEPWELLGHMEFIGEFVKHRRQVYVVNLGPC